MMSLAPGPISALRACYSPARLTGLSILLGFFLSATTASAVHTMEITDISVSDGYIYGNAVILPVGETVTIGTRLYDPAATPQDVLGVGLSYYGYDETVLGFDSGDVVDKIYSLFCFPSAGCFNGLDNQLGTPFRPLTESAGYPTMVPLMPGPTRVRVMLAYTISPGAYSAEGDPGLDGIVANDDAQFRLTFEGLSDGITSIDIGTGDDLGGIIVPASGPPIQISDLPQVRIAVPEIGTTFGLLVGGVSLLSASYARRRSGGRVRSERV